MGRKRSWDDKTVGADKKKGRGSSKMDDLFDDDEDAEMQSLLDEIDEEPLEDEAGEEKPKPKKKTRKKAKKKAKKKEPEPDEDDDDLMDDLLGDDDGEDEPEEEVKPKPKAAKKAKKTRKKAQPKPSKKTVEEVAEDVGLDIAMECPVCRDLDGTCECEEEDRSFVRRCRFTEDVKKVARCPRCEAPLSVLYIPRPGRTPPYDLAEFSAVYGCAPCQPESLAVVALGAQRSRPHPD